MANKFVWSGASGLNDGSKWEDAYTTLMRDWGAEAGFTPATDFVYVRSVHAESSSSLLLRGSTVGGSIVRIRIISVVGDTTGTTPGALATGASVTTGATDIDLAEGLYIYGVEFFSGNNIEIGSGAEADIETEQCRFELTGTSGTDTVVIGNTGNLGNVISLLDTDIDFAVAAQGLTVRHCSFYWNGGTLGFAVTTLIETALSSRRGRIKIENADLSVLTGTLCTSSAASPWEVSVERCVLGDAFTLLTGTIDQPGYKVQAIHCQSGTDSDPAFQMEVSTNRGTVKADTARYRTGGASDGERTNPIAWDLDTTVGTVRSYPGYALVSLPIVGWTDGDASTPHTYRIYFASGGTQQDDDIWFDLVGPNDAATNSMGVRKTKRVAPETAAANHTTDGASSWTGADVGTKQYMELTYTPDKPGPISAIVHMAGDAGATGHIFIDPKIYIDP